ncbi:MAG: putative Ig domain-containing protein [Actinomycetota bacterium]|nr:putative Ig domain-containing protein [Actinomycetota bacterium]
MTATYSGDSAFSGSSGTTTETVHGTLAGLAFTADSPPTATVGTAYAYTFIATGHPPPSYTVASGSLPAGLALKASTGVLSGTPTAAGSSTFTVRATNGVNPDAVSPSITIMVAAAPAAMSPPPPPLPVPGNNTPTTPLPGASTPVTAGGGLMNSVPTGPSPVSSSPAGALAFTGAKLVALLLDAAMLVIVGALLTALARKRHRRPTPPSTGS